MDDEAIEGVDGAVPMLPKEFKFVERRGGLGVRSWEELRSIGA